MALQENGSPTKRDANEIAEIMRFSIVGWRKADNPRACGAYGRQKCYERIAKGTGGFMSVEDSGVDLPFNDN